jgi:hypothetical protein
LAYAIPVLRMLGALETVAIMGGAAYDGPRAFLRNIPPPEDANARAAIAATRADLGDVAYDSASARGASMTLDELCDLMFAELDRQLAAPAP